MSTSIYETAAGLVEEMKAAGLTLATAESCTGGLIASALTSVPGASLVLERGFVTYSNDSKIQMLGVPSELIARHGAVSAEVARAMAEGALSNSKADLAIAVTGIAGPDGGGEAKPVGLVHLAGATRAGAIISEEKRFGDLGRNEVRNQAAAAAMALIRLLL
jgi:nicotinamide-nucleotide amidase